MLRDRNFGPVEKSVAFRGYSRHNVGVDESQVVLWRLLVGFTVCSNFSNVGLTHYGWSLESCTTAKISLRFTLVRST